MTNNKNLSVQVVVTAHTLLYEIKPTSKCMNNSNCSVHTLFFFQIPTNLLYQNIHSYNITWRIILSRIAVSYYVTDRELTMDENRALDGRSNSGREEIA